ncbi:hypothetical protein HQ571_00095 [Candidatus Kuenenbacteria bacterium]|nr:hypothetical protein [Candidatus Kuenenbacteria bacterium]
MEYIGKGLAAVSIMTGCTVAVVTQGEAMGGEACVAIMSAGAIFSVLVFAFGKLIDFFDI